MTTQRLTPIVVDASAFAEYVLRTGLGREVASVIEEPDAELHVPAVCDVELCGGLRRMINAAELDISRAHSALAIYVNLPIVRHGHLRYMPRIMELRDNFSAYDAAYVALCERLDAMLVTCDARLTRAAQEHVTINVVGVTTR